jgi:hemoglobin
VAGGPALVSAVTESLFQRLGGTAGIAALVDEAVDRHAANPVLAPRFRGKDLPQLKVLGVTFLAAGSGGPSLHESRATGVAPAGMRFSVDEVDAVIADVAAAMVEQGAGAAEVGEVIHLYRALEGEALRR